MAAAAPAAAEPAKSQRLTCARRGGPADRLAAGLIYFWKSSAILKGKQTTLHYWKPFLLIILHFKIYGLI